MPSAPTWVIMSALPTWLGGLCGSGLSSGLMLPLGIVGIACPPAPLVSGASGVSLMPVRLTAFRPFIRDDIREAKVSRRSGPPARGMSPGVDEEKWSEISPSSSSALASGEAAADRATTRGACRVGSSLNDIDFLVAGGVACRPTSASGPAVAAKPPAATSTPGVRGPALALAPNSAAVPNPALLRRFSSAPPGGDTIRRSIVPASDSLSARKSLSDKRGSSSDAVSLLLPSTSSDVGASRSTLNGSAPDESLTRCTSAGAECTPASICSPNRLSRRTELRRLWSHSSRRAGS